MKALFFLFVYFFLNTGFTSEKSAIVLMYHRFEDQRFPSTSISSKNFQSCTYEEYFNNKLNKNKTIQIKKNYDIIEKSDIELLRKAAEYSQLDMMARN